MESSSSDLFDQFLKTGMGAKPLIAGYESQLLEFAVQEPETWEQIKGDIVMVYHSRALLRGPPMCSSPWMRPGPWASTPCWTRRCSGWPGRTTASAPGCTTPPTDTAQFGVEGVAEEVTQVAPHARRPR